MEKFDVIVVGGGLAGLAAAYTLAQHDLEVLVLERGDYAGAKNLTGGACILILFAICSPTCGLKHLWKGL